MAAVPAFVLVAAMSASAAANGESALFGLEGGRRPPKIETLWLGLPPAPFRAPADGIVVLRPPLERRVRIAGGRFVMGSVPSEWERATKLCQREPLGWRCTDGADDISPWIRAEGHAHEVTLSDFEIDRTEVPVRRYARCVAAGACAPPGFPSGDARFDQPDYPVTMVRWEDAAAYCSWIGGRLPTEAEWEFAARGRGGRMFPWGDLYNPHLSNHGALAVDDTDGRDGFIGLAPIGSFPDGATPTGLLDMAGNAAEWVADWYERDEDQYGYGRGAQVNPKGPPYGRYGHVFRGGSYRQGAHEQRTAARRAWPFATPEIGFRCAYDGSAR
ncbi:MAG: SUMF1/EgtB/PvdO family nonheme iron enzyme [Labilithrix sp.]|nr:SUMF1/EgtB/PvdO family nonheme iron enzyme [Labilithrix sp.]